jgi:outer membrane protein assembly factor BamB
VADVNEQPGALPLLQYALTELFERREGNTLTREAYHAIGGVLGALGRRAEELYAGLDPDGQEVTHQLFLRLVTLGEGVEDTRRRVLRSELEALTKDEGPRAWDEGPRNKMDGRSDVRPPSSVLRPSSAIDEVIEVYGHSRLLTFDRDPLTRGPTVEVAHEALLREWRRLRQWLDDSRADVRMQRILAHAAAEWLLADRDASFLLRGSRLEQFEGWAAGTGLALTADERAFLDASLAARDARRADEVARLAHEAALERRAFNRLRALVAVLLIAVLVAGGLTLFAFNQSQVARRQAVEAHSLALAAAAERALSENSPVLALALALEANRIDNPPVPAQGTLYKAAYARDRNRLEGDFDAVRSVAFSPDGRTALYGGTTARASGGDTTPSDTSLILSDIATGEAVWRRAAPAAVESVAFNPDGKTVLSGLQDGTLILWDMATGEPLRRFERHAGSVSSVAFSPDGRTALSGSFDRKLILWDVETGREIHRFEGHKAPVWSVAFSPDGRLALSGASDKALLLWDIETGQEIRRLEGYDAGVRNVAFSPDGRAALVGIGSIAEANPGLVLWDVQQGEEIRRFEGHRAAVYSVAFSPDGRMALSGSGDSTMILWDIEAGEVIRRFEGHETAVQSVAFSPDGRLALSGSDDGTVRLWHLSLDALIDWIETNLHVREFTCDEREQYRIQTLCDT